MAASGDTMRATARYDGGTIALHWLTAVLVLGLWLAGTFLEAVVPEGGLRSGIWSAHFDLGFVLTGLVVAFLVWRWAGGRQLPVEDPGPLHRRARATHAALSVLLLGIVGLGIANAFVRGISLGPVNLPQLGTPEWRRSLTHWHGGAAPIQVGRARLHSGAAPVHQHLRHDAVLRRMLPRRT